MAQLPNGAFDASQVDPNSTFDPIPAGWYTAMITESEMKPTKNGAGQYLQLSLQVLEGEHAGRVLFDRLNLVNPSQVAQDIAQRTLSAICHAVGIMTVTDSTQLHDKPLQVKVKVKPAQDQYEASNEISGYKAASGSAPAKAPVKPVAAAQPEPVADSTPPWQRRAG